MRVEQTSTNALRIFELDISRSLTHPNNSSNDDSTKTEEEDETESNCHSALLKNKKQPTEIHFYTEYREIVYFVIIFHTALSLLLLVIYFSHSIRWMYGLWIIKVKFS